MALSKLNTGRLLSLKNLIDFIKAAKLSAVDKVVLRSKLHAYEDETLLQALDKASDRQVQEAYNYVKRQTDGV
jgi:uncharacterized protein YpiB (UPF0302 family)